MAERRKGQGLVEEGVGLVAQGIFRIKQQDGIEEAELTASAVNSTFKSLWLDFNRNLQKSKED